MPPWSSPPGGAFISPARPATSVTRPTSPRSSAGPPRWSTSSSSTTAAYSRIPSPCPGTLTAELTGRYISAGISEGIFEYDALGQVNVGLQRSFLAGQLNVKLSGNDLFRNFVINGGSNFDGLLFRGSILRDSRRVALSVSYNFGNQKVSSRRRDTGLDEAAGRVR